MTKYINYYIHIIKTMLPIMKDSLLSLYDSVGALLFFYAAICVALIIVEQKIAEYVYEKLPINRPAQIVIRIISFLLGFVVFTTIMYFKFINDPNWFHIDGIFTFSVIASIEIGRILEIAWGGILYLIFKLIKSFKEDANNIAKK